MKRIAIAEAYEPIGIDLWGSDYETVDLTKSKQKKVAEVQLRLAVIDEDDDGEQSIPLFGELFDLLFTPAEGHTKKASTLIKQKWASNDLSPERIENFLSKVSAAKRANLNSQLEEILANGRPT